MARFHPESALGMNDPALYLSKVDFSEKRIEFWEQQVHASLGLLAQSGALCTDEMRRTLEGMELDASYASLDYYSRWSIAMAKLLMAKGLLTEADLDRELGMDEQGTEESEVKFAPGDPVMVRPLHGPLAPSRSRWRRPHLRTPGYLFGLKGAVERFVGCFPNPSLRAFGREGSNINLYRVRFSQTQVWEAAGLRYTGSEADTVDVEVYANWLLPASSQLQDSDPGERDAKRAKLSGHGGGAGCARTETGHGHEHEHGHGHTHGDGLPHETRAEVEQKAVDKEQAGHDGQVYGEALVRALVASKLITTQGLRSMVEAIDTMGAQQEGARVVARAWVDADFKARLLEDGNAAARELGIDASNVNAPTKLTVVENTREVHNLVVCTLCSCYPAKLLGLSPQWYKSRIYRARALREPRAVLADFGTELPAQVSVRVHDSTADCRYLVLPLRPAHTEGWSEQRLADLVSRDSMIGLCPAAPVPAPAP